MPIRNQIQAVVRQLIIQPNFIYGTANEINVKLDDIQMPAVLLYNLQPAELSTTLSNAVNEKFALYMEFLFKTDFDMDTADNEAMIVAASNLRDEFLVKLQYYRETLLAPRYFKIHRNEKMKSLAIYNKKDVNSTGVNLTMTLDTMSNTGYDPESRPDGYMP